MERLHKKQEPNICFQKETHFKYKTRKQVNNERVKKTFHMNSNFFKSSSDYINIRQIKFQDEKQALSKEKNQYT